MVFHTKTGVLAVLLFLTVLFVITLQPVITGRAVYNNKEISLADYPYPFIKNNYYNDMFIVVGEQHTSSELLTANEIAAGLQSYLAAPPKIILETELPENTHNVILIGTPCTNYLIADYLNTNDCSAVENKGMVMLDAQDRKATMIVAGATQENVRLAGLFLKHYKLYGLMGNVAFIEGSIADPNGFVVNYQN